MACQFIFVKKEKMKIELGSTFYYMAEFIFPFVRKIAHADWLPSSPRLYDIGPVQ